MGRNSKAKKIVANDLFKISISSLKLDEFLKVGVYGIIDIPYYGEGLKDGIHVVVSFLNEDEPFLYFYYSILQPCGKYRDFEYDVPLVADPCRYGGFRFWFRCPLSILGCDRKVNVLYLVRNHFACHCCHNLTYKSRNSRGPYGLGVIDMSMVCASRDPRNWKYYKGSPTRRLKRLIKMDEKFRKALDIFNAKMDAKHKKTLEKMEPFMQKEKALIEEEQSRRLDPSEQSAETDPTVR